MAAGGASHCDDIAVSAEKAAGEAEYVAREVMAQQGLNAEF